MIHLQFFHGQVNFVNDNEIIQRNFSVLFLSKKDNVFAERAADFISKAFSPVPLYFQVTGKNHYLPEIVLNWKGDL